MEFFGHPARLVVSINGRDVDITTAVSAVDDSPQELRVDTTCALDIIARRPRHGCCTRRAEGLYCTCEYDRQFVDALSGALGGKIGLRFRR